MNRNSVGPAILFEDPVDDDGSLDGDSAMQRLLQWSLDRPWCMACFIPEAAARHQRWPGLETHHMVKRSRINCHEPWNLVRLCTRCHQLAEGHTHRDAAGAELPKLEFEHCLWIKRHEDLDFWQPLKLAEIYGVLPAAVEPAPFLFAERAYWRPVVHWRNLN